VPVVTLPGVSHVSTCGGAIAELQVEVETEKSTAYGIALSTVASQVRSFAEFLRTENNTESIETLSKMVIAKKNDSQIFLQDIATVRFGIEAPTCLASSSGIPMVEVQVFAAPDADSHAVAAAAKEAIESHIPGAGVELAWARDPEIRVAVEIADAGATESNSRQLQDALHEVAQRIERYPGVETVSLHAGAPDNGIATRDGADAEVRVFLSSDSDAAVLAANIEAEVDLPSVRLRSRVQETHEIASMTNWVRVYGPDLDVLGTLAGTLQTSLRELQSVQSTLILSLREFSRPSFNVKREAAAQLGISVHDIRELLLAANEGLIIRPPGTRHTAIRLKLAGTETPQELARHPIMTPRGAVPLGQLVSIELGMAPAIIRARNTRRYVEVQYSASGNDNEIRAEIAKAVQLPAQYELEWGRTPYR
jgi:Cu/Ag efflux pump CusA